MLVTDRNVRETEGKDGFFVVILALQLVAVVKGNF